MVSKAFERSISIVPPYHLLSNSFFQFSIRHKSACWATAQKCVRGQKLVNVRIYLFIYLFAFVGLILKKLALHQHILVYLGSYRPLMRH